VPQEMKDPDDAVLARPNQGTVVHDIKELNGDEKSKSTIVKKKHNLPGAPNQLLFDTIQNDEISTLKITKKYGITNLKVTEMQITYDVTKEKSNKAYEEVQFYITAVAYNLKGLGIIRDEHKVEFAKKF
jgi:hypothetical protein